MSIDSKPNYIYLLQEQRFIETKENVYKIGMTRQKNFKRFNQYPSGSILLYQTICNDCKNMETEIINHFKNTFKRRKDIGNEYFEGEYKDMINIISQIVKDEKDDYIINDKSELIYNNIIANIKKDLSNYMISNDFKEEIEEVLKHLYFTNLTFNNTIIVTNTNNKFYLFDKNTNQFVIEKKTKIYKKIIDTIMNNIAEIKIDNEYNIFKIPYENCIEKYESIKNEKESFLTNSVSSMVLDYFINNIKDNHNNFIDYNGVKYKNFSDYITKTIILLLYNNRAKIMTDVLTYAESLSVKNKPTIEEI